MNKDMNVRGTSRKNTKEFNFYLRDLFVCIFFFRKFWVEDKTQNGTSVAVALPLVLR